MPGDGIIEDPRKCRYDARSFVCGVSASPNCLTAAEADAVNKIWDGPVTSPGPDSHERVERAWYGLERGASLGGLAGSIPFGIAVDHFRYWIKQDAAFDWRTVTQASFFDDFLTSVDKFNEVIGTDDDLRNFRKAGGKMITYHGLFDSLIMPRGTYNYSQPRQGQPLGQAEVLPVLPVSERRASRRGGPEPGGAVLGARRVGRARRGARDLVAQVQVNPTRTRKICKYPDVQVYSGTGSIDDHTSFTCQVKKKDDKALIDQDKLGKEFEPKLGE